MRKTLIQCLAIAVVFLMSAATMAQTSRTVTGNVTDTQGYPLPGVNVIIQGTTTGTISDIDGNYSLEVPDAQNATLVFSFIGFANQPITIGNQFTINVVLQDSSIGLDEVVAVGYGTMRRGDLTGSIASVEGDALQSRGTTSPISALQGAIPGVNISANSSRPGASFDIQIRGQNSLNADGSTPLYVVDGIVTDNIDFLNPADIEKIDILKDASSTAIYGSRGSNGVVIVQTRNADRVQKGQTTVAYDGYYGVRQIARMPDWMNGREFTDFRTSRFYFYTPGDQSVTMRDTDYQFIYHNSDFLRNRLLNNQSTDWSDMVTRTGHQQNHYLSISGNNQDISYVLGVGYQNEKGNLLYEDFDRYNIRLSVTHKASQYFSTGGSINASIREASQGSEWGYRDAFRQNPLTRPYDDEGNLIPRPGNFEGIQSGGTSQYTDSPNPLAEIESGQEQFRRIDVLGSIYLSLTPIEGIEFRSTLAPRFTRNRRGYYFGEVSGGRTTPIARNHNQEYFDYTIDNVLTYNRDFGAHRLNTTLLNSVHKTRYEMIGIQAENLPYDSRWYNIGTGSIMTGDNTGSAYSETSLLSYAARANYSYLGKYMATATIRYDGSSKLANNRWEAFPSFALAWRMSEEDFMLGTDWLSNLKWRLSYGFSGNHSGVSAFGTQVNPRYSSLVRYNFGNTNMSGFAPGDPVNSNLTWEKTEELNIGLDYGFFNNRINGTIDLYDRVSDGLIMDRQLAVEAGSREGMIDNIGSVNNRGIEVALNTVNFSGRDFSWNTTFTFSRNINEIKELYGGQEDDPGQDWYIGHPINVVYNYDYLGVWTPEQIAALPEGMAQTLQAVEGTARFRDLNEDGFITADEDRKVLGSPDPDWIASFASNIRYKNFDFSFNVFTQQGVLVRSPFLEEFGWNGDRGRNHINMDYYIREGSPVLDYETMNWIESPGNFTQKHPMPVNGTPNIAAYTSVAQITDASFIKVQNITLGYTLPRDVINRANISSMRVYMNVLNPFVWTNYEGYDPEYAATELNHGNGPSNITYQFGVNVKF